ICDELVAGAYRSGSAAISLDPIAIWVDDESRVVIGAVFSAHAGLAVVAPASGKRRGMKSVHAFARRRAETKMQPRVIVGGNRALRLADPKGDGIASVAERVGAFAQAFVTEWNQYGIIKAFCL